MPRSKNKVLTLKEMQTIRTTLYDCSLDLKINIPRDEGMDVNFVYRVTLITIAFEFVTKHEEYRPMIDCIYIILKNTLSATKRHWKVFKKKQLVLQRNEESAGHLLNTHLPKDAPVVYDTLEFSGQIGENDDNASPVTVDCSLKLFLSPGVYAAQDVYDDHNFPVDIHKERDNEDLIDDFLDSWGCMLEEREREESGFADTWGCVYGGLEQRDEYIAYKRRQYATASETSNEEEEDSELDDY